MTVALWECAACGKQITDEPRQRTDLNGKELLFCSKDCEVFMMGVPVGGETNE
jgi:hypothetical protein